MKQRIKTLLLSFTGLLILATATGYAAQAVNPEFGNARYNGIVEQPITLKQGHWQGEPFVAGGASRPTAGLIEDFQLAGDLNGDGEQEHVVLLWSSDGGSGTRIYLAVMGKKNGQPVNLSSALIGDRVQILTGRILDNRIELDVIQGGPEDAACCPSQKATRSWTLGKGQLKEGLVMVTGKLSLADMEGVEWRLTRITHDEKLPAQPEITLRLKGNKISGRSGCNNYFSEISETGEFAGSVSIGDIGSTMMACPDEIMRLEQRYLAAMKGVNKFSFQTEKLVLDWMQGDQAGSMFFVPTMNKPTGK